MFAQKTQHKSDMYKENRDRKTFPVSSHRNVYARSRENCPQGDCTKKELLPEWELSDYHLATLELMDAIGCGGQCPSSNNAHGDPGPCMKVYHQKCQQWVVK